MRGGTWPAPPANCASACATAASASAPKRCERLFKPFEQADSSTSRRFGGTGLGLSISRELVQMMGGSIGVHSAPGVGSEFFFTLPLPLAPEGAQRAAPPPAQASSTGWSGAPQVLLVEDNEVNLLYAEAVLKDMGAAVSVARDGAQALAAVQQQSFDLVLMDCNMPGMDGLSATPRLREIERRLGRRRTPVVAFSANAMAEDRDAFAAPAWTTSSPSPTAAMNCGRSSNAGARAPRPAPTRLEPGRAARALTRPDAADIV